MRGYAIAPRACSGSGTRYARRGKYRKAAPGAVVKRQEAISMKHIKTLTTRNMKESMKKGGCGECQTSCQSACKTSCTVGNQSCEKIK